MCVFAQNQKKTKMEIFVFCVITFEPIRIQTRSAPQNDGLNLSFVTDEHIYCKQIARNGLKTVIYEGHSF